MILKASTLAWWLVLLGAADLILTLSVLYLGGIETNPIIRHHVETWSFAAVKMGIPLLIVLLVRMHPVRVRVAPLAMVAALYVWIVAVNALNLKEALGW